MIILDYPRKKVKYLSLYSVSAIGLEEWVHQQIHKQHEALLYPVIRQVIREELRAFGNRIVFFLMRIAYASEQSRILITNVLDRVLSLLLKTPEEAEKARITLIDQSNLMAKRNIIKKTEQMKSLLEEWEASFNEAGEESDNKNG